MVIQIQTQVLIGKVLLNGLSKAKFQGAPKTTTFDSLVEHTPALVTKEKKEVKEVKSNFDNLFTVE